MTIIKVVPILLLFVPTPSVAQRYHTPAEVLRIMTDSKMSYVMDAKESVEIETVKASVELPHGLFLKHSVDGASELCSYDAEYAQIPDYQTVLAAAERAFQNDSMTFARDQYLRVLKIAPLHSQVMTFIGQTYENEQDYSSAKDWYQKAIETNFYDYAAHWFLADNLSVTGRHDEALKEILLARVLNRTNPRLSEAVDRILKESKLSFVDWTFKPRYELKDLDGHRISIKYDTQHPEWMPYAFCKALWAFEPGYRDSMISTSHEHPFLIEEKECVANILIGLQNSGKKVKDPSLQAARRALDEKVFAAYLLFDVILQSHPDFVFLLTQSNLESVTSYVLEYRTEAL